LFIFKNNSLCLGFWGQEEHNNSSIYVENNTARKIKDTANDYHLKARKMNGKTSYWMVGDLPPTPASPSSSTTSDSTPSIDRNLYLTSPQARRPQTFVGIHPDSNISWAPSPSQNGNISPVRSGSKLKLTLSYKNMPTSPIAGSQIVSAVQHVPPTHHHNENGSFIKDLNNTNTLVSSSTTNSELPDVPSNPINYRDDIELDDQALVTISTKELNRKLKKKGINKSRQKAIKSERRTLKNRGYASNCRISREEEEQSLVKDILKLEDEIKKYPPYEQLEQEYMNLKKEVRDIREMMNLSDHSDDSLSDVPVIDDVKEEPRDGEDEYTSSDYENND